MENSAAPPPAFNFDTMSGVFPGTRTQVWQRLRLLPRSAGGPPACWALLLWYESPPAGVLVRQDAASARLDPAPLLRLEQPTPQDLHARLTAALYGLGYTLAACGACAHWRTADAEATGADGAPRTADGLRLGVCGLRRAAGLEVPAALAAQSHLALACAHWVEADAAPARAALPAVAPLPKIAETSESKLRPLARLRRRLARRFNPPPAAPTLAERLAERSGVGAGTEPCVACQGRIANLGALTAAAAEGDKETFSIWRCRRCYTLYLSDWVDRWERVESLETEETIHRVAPVEAAELLTLFATVPAGDHPAGRHQRAAERDWIHAQVTAQPPLRHVIKQGR